jgi:AraC-like DNA-binding protein
VTPEGEPEVDYWEFTADFEPRAGSPSTRDMVVLSNIHEGASSSPPTPGLCIRYVARGRENYRIAGRGYRLEAGQVMIAPHDEGADCEIRKVDRVGTLAVCTLVRDASSEMEWAFGPLVLGESCSSVGPILHKSAAKLWRGAQAKNELARHLIAGLRSELPNVVRSVASQAAAIEAAKPATRFEMVRRANLAQAYLHSATERAIGLDELAVAVGASPFRLLTAFQRCFGDTPASYHRKLRLNLALEEARRRGVPVSAVADEFGFAGASSFSHSYRRAFGQAPVWTTSNR